MAKQSTALVQSGVLEFRSQHPQNKPGISQIPGNSSSKGSDTF